MEVIIYWTNSWRIVQMILFTLLILSTWILVMYVLYAYLSILWDSRPEAILLSQCKFVWFCVGFTTYTINVFPLGFHLAGSEWSLNLSMPSWWKWWVAQDPGVRWLRWGWNSLMTRTGLSWETWRAQSGRVMFSPCSSPRGRQEGCADVSTCVPLYVLCFRFWAASFGVIVCNFLFSFLFLAFHMWVVWKIVKCCFKCVGFIFMLH